MNKLREAYFIALEKGILHDMIANPSLEFEKDKLEFKKALVQWKQRDKDFRLL